MPLPGEDIPAGQTRPDRGLWLLPPAFLVAGALPLVLIGKQLGRPGYDALNFHEPAIRLLAADWPHFDFADFLSATTPLYHLVLAAVARYASPTVLALQVAGLVIAAALVAVLSFACVVRARLSIALPAALTVALSPYVVASGVWLLPDNLGWMLVLCVLLLAYRDRVDSWTYFLGALALTLLVCARQVHVWAVAPLWAAAWLGPSDPRTKAPPVPELTRYIVYSLFSRPGPRLLRVSLVELAAVPGVLLLFYFAQLWHGLTPPAFQRMYQGDAGGAWLSRVNFGSLPIVFALVAVFSVFYLPMLAPAFRRLWLDRRGGYVLFAGVMGVLVIVCPSAPDVDHGRWSGLWSVGSHVPSIAGYFNPLVAALAVAGAITIPAWCEHAGRRHGVIFLTSLLAFAAAFAVSFQLWQRYAEPLVLMLLALTACQGVGNGPPARPATERLAKLSIFEPVGIVVLAILLAGSTVFQVARWKPERRLPREELMRAQFPGVPEAIIPRLDPSEPRKNPAT